MDDVVFRAGFVLFWGGWPSQWYPSAFEIDGFTYNCAEQYMMAEKARLFGDKARLKKILASDSPKSQKEHGRRVAGFDVNMWTRACRKIVYRGNYAKFTQNKILYDLLLGTGDDTIAEASPYDKIWGIGLPIDSTDATRRGKWRGTNWLGEALMAVRKQVRGEYKCITGSISDSEACR